MVDAFGFGLILHITAVDVVRSVDEGIRITARGDASSAGWTKPQLSLRSASTKNALPAEQGVLEFDFLATPPTGPAVQALEELCAESHLSDSGEVTQVRVFSKSNSVLASIPSRDD